MVKMLCLLTDLVTAAANKLNSEFEQCSAGKDNCTSNTSGNVFTFDMDFFCITLKIMYNVQT